MAANNEQDDLLALIDELDIEDLKANFSDLMVEVITYHGDDKEQQDRSEVAV